MEEKRVAKEHRHEVPSIDDVEAKFVDLINGVITREEASEWATEYIIYDDPQIYPEIENPVAWCAICKLSGADSISTDRLYLYGPEDFKIWLGEIRDNEPFESESGGATFTPQLNDGNVMNNSEKHMYSNEVLFSESYAAAQSLKNAWTRLASTYGCMTIVLSRETLTIKPHWFAGWLISPLALDLCHGIPITNIKGATEMGKWFSYGKIELHFVTIDGESRRILLYMKKYHEFINTLKNAIHQ